MRFFSGSPAFRRAIVPFASFAVFSLLIAALALLTAAASGSGPAGQSSSSAAPASPEWKLWYRQPAAAWTEALPVGNGRLGAMVFGGTQSEIIRLNEDTVWTGGPYDPRGTGSARMLRQQTFPAGPAHSCGGRRRTPRAP